MPKTEIELRLPRPKDKIETEVFEGILAGARASAANLFTVANSGPVGDDVSGRANRARLIKLKVTTAMMLELVEEVFGDDKTSAGV